MTLSIDVGGTFTDFVIIDEGIEYFKVPSTPSDPERGIYNGLKGTETEGDIFHGTTVATNAFLEGKGVKTAFITNQGFEDILFIGRQDRPELYNFEVKKEKPPLEREDCYGISGRVDADGNVLEKIDEDEIEDIASEIKDRSAAVCLLHSYADPEQEKKVEDVLAKHNIPFSLSHQVSREFREYERGMTCLMDAYLGPLIRDYFDSIIDILGEEPLIMKSSGGLEPASEIDPVDTFYSGPAGGVAGGAFIADITGEKNLVTFDMGGTSADMAAIVDGEIEWKDEGKIGDFPVQSRMVDLVTVGSGGGSIARMDEGGALRVGPESAGARPGPVCYGRGGERPTITDALLSMGYIDPLYFLGGEMDLDKEGAERELKSLSDELDMNLDETLLGIFRVANSKMARTMKEITVERGLDPNDFSILAFGGAGPLHAAYLAEELNISKVIVPPLPGVFSALGMAAGDIIRDYKRTLITDLDNEERIDEAVEELREEASEGEENILLGLRYKGQSYHINILYSEEGGIKEAEEMFHEEHEDKYGYYNEEADIEVVRIHLEMRERRELETFVPEKGVGGSEGDRYCLFPEGEMKTKVYRRNSLTRIPEDERERGPVIIEDTNSTILVPPGWSFYVDEYTNIHMIKEGKDE